MLRPCDLSEGRFQVKSLVPFYALCKPLHLVSVSNCCVITVHTLPVAGWWITCSRNNSTPSLAGPEWNPALARLSEAHRSKSWSLLSLARQRCLINSLDWALCRPQLHLWKWQNQCSQCSQSLGPPRQRSPASAGQDQPLLELNLLRRRPGSQWTPPRK